MNKYTLDNGKIYENTPREVDVSAIVNKINDFNQSIAYLGAQVTDLTSQRDALVATLQSVATDIPDVNTIVPEIQNIPEVVALLTAEPMTVDPVNILSANSVDTPVV